MKWKVSLTVLLTVALSLVSYSSVINAESIGEPFSMIEKKEMLRNVANEKGIPAEVLKAIASKESKMQQFDSNGQPKISDDGGIGIMQVTMSESELEKKGIDLERLKWDTLYNIQVGADILLEKWNNNLPRINEHEQIYLENWYFAVMAYNGLSKRNDPNLYGENTYQEGVYQYLENNSVVEIAETPEIMISYPYEDRPAIMVFEDRDYTWGSQTQTTQNLQTGDMVYTYNPFSDKSTLRSGVDGDRVDQLLHNTPLEIIEGPFESSNSSNHYVFYKVKGYDGVGYMASANIVPSEFIELFSDITSQETQLAVSYLQQREIINGYTDGTYRPNQELLRRHAAKLLVKALDLELPEGYEMKADDMQPGDIGYEDMIIAEAHGLMGKGGKLRPYEYLDRAQMASILVRAFDKYYDEPTSEYSFSGVPKGYWNYDDINTLAYNDITIANPYRPGTDVTRSQFALFLERTVKLKEEKMN